MDALTALVDQSGFLGLTWHNVVMFGVGGLLVFLAVRKNYEPLLLVPIGFGAILANLPRANMSAGELAIPGSGHIAGGLLQYVYDAGVSTEFLPPVIFLGVGALTDFRPLLARPITFLLGAAAQFGVFIAAAAALYIFGFTMKEAATIGIIGGADGPTTIFLAAQLAPQLLGAVAVAAYSYMSLVPIIQPPVMRLLTTSAERAIAMPQARVVSRTAVVVFPVATAVLVALCVPGCAPLIGLLMFGNLLRETGAPQIVSVEALFGGVAGDAARAVRAPSSDTFGWCDSSPEMPT